MVLTDHLDSQSMCFSPALQNFLPLQSDSAIPGRWKHGLCNVCQYGMCHPSCCQACCCVPLAAGQVLTRLGVPWYNRKGPRLFQFLLVVCGAFWITRVFFFLLIAFLDPNIDSTEWIEPGSAYYTVIVIDDSLALIYFAFSIYLLRYARQRVRQRHAISEGDACPAGCEDTCCSLFCSCCVASQLLRQSTDYTVAPARCCTEHGLLFLQQQQVSPPSMTTTTTTTANGAVELV